jgi:hypothetical protein
MASITVLLQTMDALNTINELLGEAVELGRSSWTSIKPPTTNDCCLEVYDFGYADNAFQRMVGHWNNRATLKSGLESLPKQETMFRVYLFEESSIDNSALLDHLQFLVGKKTLNYRNNTFEALASQWRKSKAMRYESMLYLFDPIEQLKPTQHDQAIVGLTFLAGMVRMIMSVQILDITGTEDRFIGIFCLQIYRDISNHFPSQNLMPRSPEFEQNGVHQEVEPH